jgi:class 3 adenylate cyclase
VLQDEAKALGFTTLIGHGYEGVREPLLLFRASAFPSLDIKLSASADPDEATAMSTLLGLVDQIVDAAKRTPLFLLLDDLHWADESSLTLLRHLIYRIASVVTDTPLFVLASSRPSEGANLLRRDQRCAVIELARLNELESVELARRLGAADLAPDALWARTGGIPLLIEWALGNSSPVDLPAAFDLRLSGLSRSCLAVLERAALLVPDLTVGALVRLGRWDAATVGAAVDEAVLAGVLSVHREQLDFAHPLLREWAVRDLGPLGRAEAHAEISQALGGAPTVTLARHLIGAGHLADPDVVTRVAAEAGQQAAAMCAWEEGARFFEAALEAEPRSSDPGNPTERARLHVGAGTCRRRALDDSAAIRHFRAAALLSTAAGDEGGAAQARRLQLTTTLAGGTVPPDELADLAALVDTVEVWDPELAAEVLIDISQGESVIGHVAPARTALERALALAEPAGLHGTASRAYMARAIARWVTLELVEALEDLRRAGEHASLADDPWKRTHAAYREPLLLVWLGRLRKARLAVESARAIREELKSSYEFGLVLATEVSLAVLAGDLPTAEDHADDALRLADLSHYRWPSELLLPTIAFARLNKGDVPGAHAALDEWDRGADARTRFVIRAVRDLVVVRSGDAGREVLDRLPRLPSRPVMGAQDLAVVTIEIARELNAPEVAERAVTLLERTIGTGMQVSNLLSVCLARVAGDGHLLLGNDDAARSLYAAAMRFADEEDATAESALARLGLARLEVANRSETAATVLRAAFPLLDRTSLSAAKTEAASLARRLSVAAPVVQTVPDAAVSEIAVVLFVDVVDSTGLAERLGDHVYRGRARILERGLRAALAEDEGQVMPGTTLGDGVLAVFAHSDRALHAAFTALGVAAGAGLHLHVGLHRGRVLFEDDAVHGTAVNICARICALSAADEILVSEATKSSLDAPMATAIEFVDRGMQQLKGVREPLHIFSAVAASEGRHDET